MKKKLKLLSAFTLFLFLTACPHYLAISFYNNSHNDLTLLCGNIREKLSPRELFEVKDWRSCSEKERGKPLINVRVIQDNKEKSYSINPASYISLTQSTKGSPVSTLWIQVNSDMSLQVINKITSDAKTILENPQ